MSPPLLELGELEDIGTADEMSIVVMGTDVLAEQVVSRKS